MLNRVSVPHVILIVRRHFILLLFSRQNRPVSDLWCRIATLDLISRITTVSFHHQSCRTRCRCTASSWRHVCSPFLLLLLSITLDRKKRKNYKVGETPTRGRGDDDDYAPRRRERRGSRRRAFRARSILCTIGGMRRAQFE